MAFSHLGFRDVFVSVQPLRNQTDRKKRFVSLCNGLPRRFQNGVAVLEAVPRGISVDNLADVGLVIERNASIITTNVFAEAQGTESKILLSRYSKCYFVFVVVEQYTYILKTIETKV